MKRLYEKNIIFLITFFFVFVFSCANSSKQLENKSFIEQNQELVVLDTVLGLEEEIIFQDTFDSIASGLNFKPKTSYTTTKEQIITVRNRLSQEYKTETNSNKKDSLLDVASLYFTKSLLNDIIPHWYGTEWDFNGYSNIPNQGTIACGYFVSTTLKHMGLNLNRYKMAQQASSLEVKSIAINANNIVVSKNDNISDTLKRLKEGVYIVGLDNHVGYLYLYNSKTYFIHSNYIDDRVMIELTDHSPAFMSETYYMINITHNTLLVKKWLKNEKITIHVK